MNWALDVDAGSGSAKLVLLILANRANEKGHCWPGIDGIAEQANMHRASVMRNIKTLSDRGLLEIESRGGDGKGRKSNVYKLAMEGAKSQNATLHSATSKVAFCDGLSRTVRPEPTINPKRTQRGASKSPNWSAVANLNQDAWAEWLADRRRRRLRSYTTTREADRLAKLPHDKQRECVEHSLDRYQGLFPDKFVETEPRYGEQPQAPPKRNPNDPVEVALREHKKRAEAAGLPVSQKGETLADSIKRVVEATRMPE